MVSDGDRINHLIPPPHADPEELTRRVYRCDLKHGSPWKRPLGKQGHQHHRQRSGDCLDLKIKERNTSWKSRKIGKLNSQYPKVVLCDVANNGVTLSQDCSYNLPDVLRTKVIRCFKQKMRAIYRFEPSCLGYNAHQNENEAAAKNRECCPSVQSERSICPSWRGTEHQRHLRECTDAQTFSRHTTCSLPEELTSEGSAACSASLSAGEQLHMVGGCGPDVGDRGVGEDVRPGFPLARPADLTEKRIKMGDDIQSSTPHLEYTTIARSDCGDGEETCSWVTDGSQSCAEYALGNSTSLGFTGNKKGFREELNLSQAAMLSKAFAEDVNKEMDGPASFTCQRVQAYVRKSVLSCARTDMPWPFPNRLQNTASHAVPPVCPAELIDPPDNSESSRNRNEPNTFTNSAIDSHLDAPKCFFSKPSLHAWPNYGKEAGRKDEVIEAKQSNGKNHDHGANVELASNLVASERSQAGPASDGTDWSPIAASALLLPDGAPQTDSTASTPPPSVLGLNDWGSATTLSSLSSPSIVPALSSQQKEPSSVDSAEASFPSCLVQIVEMPPFPSEKSHRRRAAPFSPSQSTDSSESCESFLLLPQDTNTHRMVLADAAPRQSLPYINMSQVQPHHTEDKLSECVLPTSGRLDTGFILPPILSPVSSPHVASKKGPLAPCQGHSDEEELLQKATCSHSKSDICDVSKVSNVRCGTSTGDTEEAVPGLKPVSLSLTHAVSARDTQKGSAEQRSSKTFEADTSDLEVRTLHPAGVLRERHYSSSRHDDDSRAAGSFASCSGGEMEQTNVEADAVLDEFSAFEQDILLIDVTQDDPELFENVPQESLINLGPTRTQETTRTARPLPVSHGASSAVAQRLVLRCGTSLMDRVFPC